MGAKRSTVRMRELGMALRKAMRGAGLGSNDVARRLGWSRSKVSNMLNAHRGVSEADVASLLTLCGVVGAERERLLRLTHESHQPGWWQEYGARLPTELRTLIDHEDSATALTEYHPVLIPGLLQIGDYTRALIKGSATIPSAEIEERVAARLKRQEVLGRPRPAQFRFIIDERTLCPGGVTQEMLSNQVHHLLRMTVRPHVDIRIVLDSAGFHAGANGPFMLMEFAEIDPVVHIENETSSLFAERLETTRAYRQIVRHLVEVALDREESREWIARRATKLGAPREEHDETGVAQE